MFKRLLVPLDGSPEAETALEPALALAQRFEAELLLVRTVKVHPFPGTDPGQAYRQAMEAAEAYLETVATQLRKEGVQVLTSIPYDSLAAGIIDQAAFRRVDLIVMGAPRRKGLKALLHPRIAWKVLTHTDVPLLIWKGSVAQDEKPRRPGGLTAASAPRAGPQDGLRPAEHARPERGTEETPA